MNMMDNAIHNDDLTIEAVKHGVDDAANRNEPDAMAINEPISDVNGDVLRPLDAGLPLLGTSRLNGILISNTCTRDVLHKSIIELETAKLITITEIAVSGIFMEVKADYTGENGPSVYHWTWEANE